MKGIAAVSRVKVSADGRGVVSHAGMGLVRELADQTGLTSQVTAVLADTYKGPWVYAAGAVFADLAAAVADGADCIDGVGQLCGDREHVLTSGRRPRPRRCGGWSTIASTPRTCRRFVRPAPRRGRRPGPPEQRPRLVRRCISTSMPRWSSTIPTTRPSRHRHAKSRISRHRQGLQPQGVRCGSRRIKELE